MSVYAAITRLLTAVSRWLALLGGVLLLAVVAIVVLSVTGRNLVWIGLAPIPGDFELVQLSTALAIFCFLPWCQIQRAHVSVDILAPVLGKRLDAALSVLFNAMMTAATAFIAWRLSAGMGDYMLYGETTFILRLPVWWGYAVCVPVAWFGALVAAWTVVRSVVETTSAERPR